MGQLSGLDYSAKVVLVTGGTKGIGAGIARSFLQAGARVIVCGRTTPEVLPRAGSAQAVFMACDVRDPDSLQALFEGIRADFGRLDVLVNNVGGTIWAKPFEHYRAEEIEAEVRRSLFPTLWCCHAALPYMLEQGSGAIVNVSSIATRSVNRVPYAAAKGGVNALTACLAFENAQRGIRVNATAPGGTEAPPRRIARNENEQSPEEQVWYRQIVDQTLDSSLMKRYASLDEQVGAILFLASDEASYITGEALNVSGGEEYH